MRRSQDDGPSVARSRTPAARLWGRSLVLRARSRRCGPTTPGDDVAYLHHVAGEKSVRQSPGKGKRVSSLRENPVSSLGEIVSRLRGQSLTLGPRSRGSGKPTEELDLIMIRLRLLEPSSRFLEPVHDTSPQVAKSGTGTAALGVKTEELDSLLDSRLAARLCRAGHRFNCDAC